MTVLDNTISIGEALLRIFEAERELYRGSTDLNQQKIAAETTQTAISLLDIVRDAQLLDTPVSLMPEKIEGDFSLGEEFRKLVERSEVPLEKRVP